MFDSRYRPEIPWGNVAVSVVIAFVVIVVVSFISPFWYWVIVDPDEVGVKFESGRITELVGPGFHSDFGPFVDLKKVSSKAVQFTVEDQELITKDKQRIGLQVSGDAFRPRLENKELIHSLWAQYSGLFLRDDELTVRIQDRARQAMKVCVGEKIFDEAVIGEARDALRECIDNELNDMAAIFGISVENVVVPNVILSPEVQARLDEITASRLQTEKAAQDKLKIEAEARAEQARQEGEIRVQQARIQEESRQQAELAKLEEAKIKAQQAVIEAERANELARVEAQQAIDIAEKNNELAKVNANEAIILAQKENELLAAQKELEIQQAHAVAAAEQAKADTAHERAVAEIYTANPEYKDAKVTEAIAKTLTDTDKIIFTPEGMDPVMVVSGQSVLPTLDPSREVAAK